MSSRLRFILLLLCAAIVILAVRRWAWPRPQTVNLSEETPVAVTQIAGAEPSPAPEQPTVTPPALAPTVTQLPTIIPSDTPASPPATSTPTPPLAPTPGPTVSPDLALEFTALRQGEFLFDVVTRSGVPLDAIVAASDIANPDIVAAGQGLIIPYPATRLTPPDILLPDSELVYGPAYLDFDTAAFVAGQGGYLAGFSMADGRGGRWSGAEAVERVAMRYSVGPRVLLALLEARGGWVTNPEPDETQIEWPAGHTAGAGTLLLQLEWAADELNHGFYGWLDRGETAIRTRDRLIARGAPGLNPGTVAIQRTLAADSRWADLPAELSAFSEAYRRLFGAPFARDAGPILPAGLTQPALQLPWAAGEWWYLTSGPHGAWDHGSSWAALDFVPETAPGGSCEPADAWAVAAAPGVVARNDHGELLLDLDGDGDVKTGWVLQYLHISERAGAGTEVESGTALGRPSCEGGAALSAHLHIARRYNGVWVAADGPAPFTLGGWRATGGFEYEGGLSKAGEADKTACDCRDRALNGLIGE